MTPRQVTDTVTSAMEVHVNSSEGLQDCNDVDSFVPWDNPDNVITFETFAAIENILICYFNPVIFCIGVPANVLNCVVFFRQGCFIFCCCCWNSSSWGEAALCLANVFEYLIFNDLTGNAGSVLHFIFAPFNCCLSVVLLLDKGAYPENSHVVLCHIKYVFFLTFHAFEFW